LVKGLDYALLQKIKAELDNKVEIEEPLEQQIEQDDEDDDDLIAKKVVKAKALSKPVQKYVDYLAV
jgi:hypothetical protein